MTDEKRKIESLLALVAQKSEHPLSTITNLNRLVAEIKKSTGEKLSVSTLRRLLGMVDSDHEPSIGTLDILSRYVGYRGWRDFIAHDEGSDAQSQFVNEKLIRCDQLNAGDIVELEWAPARMCRLLCLGYGRFKALLSINSKLAEGDTLCCKVVCVGQPFVATDVLRGDRLEKVYVAGSKLGVSALRLLKKE